MKKILLLVSLLALFQSIASAQDGSYALSDCRCEVHSINREQASKLIKKIIIKNNSAYELEKFVLVGNPSVPGDYSYITIKGTNNSSEGCNLKGLIHFDNCRLIGGNIRMCAGPDIMSKYNVNVDTDSVKAQGLPDGTTIEIGCSYED